MRSFGTRVTTGIALLVAAGVFASAAQAATLEVVDGAVVFTAAPGETNDLGIVGESFTDLGAPLSAGPGCEQIDANRARCSGPPVVETGDGDDRVDVRFPCCGTVTVHGGTGADNILIYGNGLPAGDLDGGPGNDVLRSNQQLGGLDVLRGGPGDDVLRIEFYSNLGGHQYGGDGDDELYFEGRWPGLPRLFNPLVMDGGNGNDTYRFQNDYVDDAMVPGPGLDILDETAALGYFSPITFDLSVCPGCVERVIGTPNDDVIIGDSYAQTIEGGAGNDSIDGGGGEDVLAGQEGDDTITARDSVFDMVGCDGGLDSVVADPFDRISRDCETVSRRPAPRS